MTNLGFQKTVAAIKYADKLIAMTKEVYAEKDRDDNIKGHDYIYRVVKEDSKQLDCRFENQRIKLNSAKAVFQPYRDVADRDHEEHIFISKTQYKVARDRYLSHLFRVNVFKKKEAGSSSTNDVAIPKQSALRKEEEEAKWCTDLEGSF